MINLMPIEPMIQKTGISAYISLIAQLATPFQTTGKRLTTHLQYRENLIKKYSIKIPITDKCNTRAWEKTYNVNLESLKGGTKHLRYSKYNIYTEESKKAESTGGGFVVYYYDKKLHTYSFKMQDPATVY